MLAGSILRVTVLDFYWWERAGATAKLTDNIYEVLILACGNQVLNLRILADLCMGCKRLQALAAHAIW